MTAAENVFGKHYSNNYGEWHKTEGIGIKHLEVFADRTPDVKYFRMMGMLVIDAVRPVPHQVYKAEQKSWHFLKSPINSSDPHLFWVGPPSMLNQTMRWRSVVFHLVICLFGAENTSG